MSTNKKVLAVASEGGHWIELQRLIPAFEDHTVRFVTTNADLAKQVEQPTEIVTDANLKSKFKLIIMFIQTFFILIKFRPDVVITTGAAPGFAAILWGKLFRAKTIWVDSIANAEELSKSGRNAQKIADVWLTQWEHLATKDGPIYKGKVL